MIDNLVIDNQFGNPSFGLVISGIQSTPDFSSIRFTNSIITNSYYGLYVDASGGFYVPNLTNLAYYGNFTNDSPDLSSFHVNQMLLTASPFLAPADPNTDWPYYIDPASPVASVNLDFDLWTEPEQLLTRLNESQSSRGNTGIGFGMPIPDNYSTSIYTPKSDFDGSGRTNLLDFAVFSDDWLTTRGSANHPDPNGYSVCDFNFDEIVDVNDLQHFSEDWLSNGSASLAVTENADAITITAQPVQGFVTRLSAMFLNGKHVGTREHEDNPDLIIQKMKEEKGSVKLRAVIKGENGVPYVTESVTASIDTSLTELRFEEFFDPDKYYPISGKVDAGYTASVAIQDLDDVVLWSSDFTGDFSVFIDPNNVFGDDVNFTVNYSCVPTSFDMLPDDMLQAATSGPAQSSTLALGGKPNSRTAALIYCMVEDGMDRGSGYVDTGNCRYAEKKIKGKGVETILLLGYGEHSQVNFLTFKRAIRKYPNIRYLHGYAHGNYESNGAGLFGIDEFRTRQLLGDGEWVSYNSQIWTWNNLPVPAGYEYLASGYESGNCFAMLPFRQGQIVVAVFVSCLNARNIVTVDGQGLCTFHPEAFEWEEDHQWNAHPDYPYSDMTFALNMWTDNQVLISSGDWVLEGGLMPYWRRFFNGFWEGMATGTNKGDDALLIGFQYASNIDVERKVRFRGLGLSNVTLSSNPGTYSMTMADERTTTMSPVFSGENPVAISFNEKEFLQRDSYNQKQWETVK